MTPESLFAGVLLVLAGFAGGHYFSRRRGTGTTDKTRRGPGDAYFRGLRYLVDEQPDKAIEVFTRLLEADSDTLETHFALGSLFRRRGETERAIRIHQNIIARPDLARTYRERALFALAEDYRKAGLLDRAERLFSELTASSGLREEGLVNLAAIYEQQSDWQQAIECQTRRSDSKDPGTRNTIAHYYCELSEEALGRHDSLTARKNLRKARSLAPENVRSALIRARIAADGGDSKLAQKLLLGVLRHRPDFALVVFPRLLDVCNASGKPGRFEDVVSGLLRRQPALKRPLAHAAILERRLDDPVSLACLEEYVRSDRILGAILEALVAGTDAEADISRPATLRQIRLVLRRLALDGPRFACSECGFTSRSLVWRCPSCLSWESVRPVDSLQFVSHLGPIL